MKVGKVDVTCLRADNGDRETSERGGAILHEVGLRGGRDEQDGMT